MLQDIRLAFRQLGKSPVFTVVVLATLALGIGANTTIFSLVNSILLKPLPYQDSDRIVAIGLENAEYQNLSPSFSGPLAQEVMENTTSFDAISVYNEREGTVHADGKTWVVKPMTVSSSHLSILGLQPLIGRDFTAVEDDVATGENVVILSYDYWQSRHGGDPAVLGQDIMLRDSPKEVIGVLPPNALLQEHIDMLMPSAVDSAEWKKSITSNWARMYARLKSGVSLAQATTELVGISERYYARHSGELKPETLGLRPLQQSLVQNRVSVV